MVSDRPMYRQMACHMVVLGICTLSFDQSAKAASLANGNWVVEERCGEFKAAKDPAAQKGFNWEIDIVRVTGSKHSVNPANAAVTNVTYQGSIKGSDVVITGIGKRSNLDTPWTYAYAGKIDADGRAKLIGAMSMKFGNSPKPTPKALRAAKTKGKRLGNPNIDAIRDQAVAATKAISDRYAENTLPIVRQIQASGAKSLREIARALQARGIPTARGGQWTPVQVSNLLKRAQRA
jgi:hypothetical protein